MMVVLEGIMMCFWLLMVCVIGIKNGPVGLVCMYEKDVQQRVVELGLITKKKIQRATVLSGVALFFPVLVVVPLVVYCYNGANGFWDGFWQMTIINWIMGLFDRLFVDWYWVGHTKTWQIPGTEDLKPYIPIKALLGKWTFTLLGFPLISAFIAWIVSLL